MNEAIHVKIISLAHRYDRREACIEELRRIGMPASPGVFFDARHMPDFGAMGCSLSHAMMLSEFLVHTDKDFALVLEDDFQIRDPATFGQTIEMAVAHARQWDVFLLGHNVAVPIEATPMPATLRVVNAQTTSGYLVGRRYAARLVQSHLESAELLRSYRHLPEPNRHITTAMFSCDILWKPLQVADRYWATLPSLISQRSSFSDVENRVVDYGV